MLEEYGDVLTFEEMCEALRIGRNSGYRLLKTQIIPAKRIGRIWRIPKTAIINYLLRS